MPLALWENTESYCHDLLSEQTGNGSRITLNSPGGSTLQRSMWQGLLYLTPFFLVVTIRYNSVYLTCSKKLTGSQLSPPHGTNKKIKM